MTNMPQNAPSAYPQYAGGAPALLNQSFPVHAASQPAPGAANADYLQSTVPGQAPPAPANQGQAWQLLSQAATAMAVASQAPPAAQAPLAPAPAQVPAAGVTAGPAGGGGLRMTGPWVAGQLYGVVPAGPLTPVPDNAEKWFAIMKGRYIGLTNSAAIADGAVSRVSNSLRTGYGSQSEALEAFNTVLAMGLVAVLN
ncbi:hypothetical protein B0H11DRAFT_1903481 [Mycena galericulata]|nr:hypothetical protein B0H11DRAFT_1903481 [Mycena galericulata]